MNFRSFTDEMLKIAEEERAQHPAVPYLSGIGGFALGTGLGYGGMELANRHLLKNKIPRGSALGVAVPVASGLAGLGGSALAQHMYSKSKGNMEAREKTDVGEGS